MQMNQPNKSMENKSTNRRKARKTNNPSDEKHGKTRKLVAGKRTANG